MTDRAPQTPTAAEPAKPVTAAGIVEALGEHFGRPVGGGQSAERDIAIWIARGWTNDSARAIGEAFRCDHRTVDRARERIDAAMKRAAAANLREGIPLEAGEEDLSEDQVLQRRVRAAEDYLAVVAFPTCDGYCVVCEQELGDDAPLTPYCSEDCHQAGERTRQQILETSLQEASRG